MPKRTARHIAGAGIDLATAEHPVGGANDRAGAAAQVFIFPLAVVLPRLLENIEAELAKEKLEAGEELHVSRRAELIRWFLAHSLIT